MKITMDRYQANWGMVELGWQTHVLGEGRKFGPAREAIETLRQENPDAIDQDLPPFVIGRNNAALGPIQENDSVIFFNFRGDRAIEISMAFEEDEFDKFPRGPKLNVKYAGMMQYDGDALIPKKYLVNPPGIERTVAEYLVKSGVRQLAISETQKFGHVTYFFNGNRSGKFDETLEDYIEIPSDIVPFEERPWMKAAEITDKIVEAVKSGEYDFIRLNYANGDMVGHTGIPQAVEIAVETVDLCMRRLVKAVKKANKQLAPILKNVNEYAAKDVYDTLHKVLVGYFLDKLAIDKFSNFITSIPGMFLAAFTIPKSSLITINMLFLPLYFRPRLLPFPALVFLPFLTLIKSASKPKSVRIVYIKFVFLTVWILSSITNGISGTLLIL